MLKTNFFSVASFPFRFLLNKFIIDCIFINNMIRYGWLSFLTVAPSPLEHLTCVVLSFRVEKKIRRSNLCIKNSHVVYLLTSFSAHS